MISLQLILERIFCGNCLYKHEENTNMRCFVKENRERLLLILFILMHTIILFLLCKGLKITRVNDEMVYYGIAKSIYDGEGVLFRGAPFPLQNLGYVFYLVPFMAIGNTVIRIQAIVFMNCFIWSFCTYIIWLICRELQIEKKYSWCAVFFLSIWPDNVTAGTLMSENIYWFVCILAFYFFVKLVSTKMIRYAILTSISFFYAFFCKEVGICLVLAYVAYLVVISLKGVVTKKKELDRQDYINCVIVIIMYFVIYVFIKQIVMKDVGNIYSYKLSYDYFIDKYSYCYFIYSFVYYCIATVVAFLILPVVLPGLYIKKMDKMCKHIYIYAIILLLGTIFTIICTITMHEDLGRIVPRIHLRYYSPVIALFIPIFLKIWNGIEKRKGEFNFSMRKGIELCSIVVFFCFAIFKGTYDAGCINENISLAYTDFFREIFPVLFIEGEGTVLIYSYAWVTNILIMLYLALMVIFIYAKGARVICTIAGVSLMCLVCVFNDYIGVRRLGASEGDPDTINEVCEINEYINSVDSDANVMLLCSGWRSNDATVFDTYNNIKNYYEVDDKTMISLLRDADKNEIAVSDMEWTDPYSGQKHNLEDIDYFVISDNIDIDEIISGLEYIPDVTEENFKIYRNIDDSNLILGRSLEILFTIDFTNENNNSNTYVLNGISICEGTFTWTEGRQAEIEAKVDAKVSSVNVSFDLCGVFNEEQEVVIYQNGTVLFNKIIGRNNMDEINFDMDITSGYINFVIELPDAVSPNTLGVGGDARELALGLEKMKFRNKTE